MNFFAIFLIHFFILNPIRFSICDIKQEKNKFDVNKQFSNKTNENQEIFAFYQNLGNKIIAILSPILLVIGGVGNPLCIAVLLNKKQRNSTVVYLSILAIFDFLVLYSGLLRQYVNQIWNNDIRNVSSFFCKSHVIFLF